MKRMIKELTPLAIVLCIIVLLQGCGKDNDNIESVENFGQNNNKITCINKNDGYYYWETANNRCALYCIDESIKNINCVSR